MRKNICFVLATFILAIPNSLADFLLLSSDGKFLFQPKGTQFQYDSFAVRRCAGSIPNELLEKSLDRFCPETLKVMDMGDLRSGEDLELSEMEEHRLKKEMERTGLSLKSTGLSTLVLLKIFSKQFGVLDTRKLPTLALAISRMFGISEYAVTEKVGTFKMSFARRSSVKLSADGWAIYYTVRNTVIGFDLWSEIVNLKVTLSDYEKKDCCSKAVIKQKIFQDHALTADGRYLVALARAGDIANYFVIYDRFEDETIKELVLDRKRFETESSNDEDTNISRILGFSETGEAVALRAASKEAKVYFISFKALLNGELVFIEAPPIEGLLKRSIFGRSKEDAVLQEAVAAIKPEKGQSEREIISDDGSTVLRWVGGDYQVTRIPKKDLESTPFPEMGTGKR